MFLPLASAVCSVFTILCLLVPIVAWGRGRARISIRILWMLQEAEAPDTYVAHLSLQKELEVQLGFEPGLLPLSHTLHQPYHATATRSDRCAN